MIEQNYLLKAIERLTLPQTTKVPQQSDAGISCVSEVMHAPLLKQLKAAIGGNVGRHSTSQQAREKIPLNTAAYELFKEIADQVDKWMKELFPERRPGFEELWRALGRCYIEVENRRRSGRAPYGWTALFEKTVIGWVRLIENMFDPPNVFEITKLVGEHDVPEQCPICGEAKALDPKTGNLITALVIEYRHQSQDTLTNALTNAAGHCRFCETVWPGSHALRELRWLLDHPVHVPEEAVA